MHALRGLGKLHLVADKYEVARAHAHRDDVGDRHLTCFVDEHEIERLIQLLAREQPCRTRDQLIVAIEHGFVVADVLDDPATHAIVVARTFLHAVEFKLAFDGNVFDFLEQRDNCLVRIG